MGTGLKEPVILSSVTYTNLGGLKSTDARVVSLSLQACEGCSRMVLLKWPDMNGLCRNKCCSMSVVQNCT